jgi:hypothetical protein
MSRAICSFVADSVGGFWAPATAQAAAQSDSTTQRLARISGILIQFPLRSAWWLESA